MTGIIQSVGARAVGLFGKPYDLESYEWKWLKINRLCTRGVGFRTNSYESYLQNIDRGPARLEVA